MMVALLKKVDTILLKGLIRISKRRLFEHKFRRRLARSTGRKMELYYFQNNSNALTAMFDKHGSDKGSLSTELFPYPWPPHSYSDVYSFVFGPKRNHVNLLIECGIGTNNPEAPSSMGVQGRPGASLRAWRDYFRSAKIVGVDIDKEILFAEDRIETYYCDQTSASSIAEFREDACIKAGDADIIIDDGLHTFEAGRMFFENTIELLAGDGIYVIEDVKPDDAITYSDYFRGKNAFQVQFCYIRRPELPVGYNVVIFVQWACLQGHLEKFP